MISTNCCRAHMRILVAVLSFSIPNYIDIKTGNASLKQFFDTSAVMETKHYMAE